MYNVCHFYIISIFATFLLIFAFVKISDANLDTDNCGYIEYITHEVWPLKVSLCGDGFIFNSIKKLCEKDPAENTNENSCKCDKAFNVNSDGYCIPSCFSTCLKKDRCFLKYGKDTNILSVWMNYCMGKDCYCNCTGSILGIQDKYECSYDFNEDFNLITTCRIGHEKDYINSHLCKPICDPKCENGNCTGVNQCTCEIGYEKDYQKTHLCIPTCNPKCENGICTGVNQCTCNAGYKKDYQKPHLCIPTCDPKCENGNCIGVNQCTCNAGYKKDFQNAHLCIPTCDPECENGNCIGVNQCTCNAGYKKDFQNAHLCIPTCNPECENGNCIGVNQCTCEIGYENEYQNGHVCKRITERNVVEELFRKKAESITIDTFRDVWRHVKKHEEKFIELEPKLDNLTDNFTDIIKVEYSDSEYMDSSSDGELSGVEEL
ncbi:uncharacterized protein LOC143912401 [Arctopsyche grandis]|uniref:uncharacterized protein LOC143912401 n=1 Tax=Arctopsyche grandis TaxID=121162 RepID=UPI00406D7AAE